MKDIAAETVRAVSEADNEEVAALVRRAGTSFYRGMRVLPKERRAAMYALYAFCRMVDDIADGSEPMKAKRAALDHWRARIDALRREDFLAIIDGMEMDAEAPIIAPDLAALDLYCDRVAAAVGRLSVRIFGDASPAADRVANALGRALQLTNILRDLTEDAERGRLYLPREWLEAAHVPKEPAAALASPGLPLVCARTAALAHSHFDRASEAMRSCNTRAMRPARLMKATYAAILARLEQRGWKDPGETVNVPTWQKLWLALRHGVV